MIDDTDVHSSTRTGRIDDDRDEPLRSPLEAVTLENDAAPDECAIFPRETTAGDLATAWIAAQEGSFVDLESMR